MKEGLNKRGEKRWQLKTGSCRIKDMSKEKETSLQKKKKKEKVVLEKADNRERCQLEIKKYKCRKVTRKLILEIVGGECYSCEEIRKKMNMRIKNEIA